MFQVASYISKITTMGNQSLRLQLDLDKELNPEDAAKVFAQYNKLGWFIFKESEILEEDLVDVPAYVKEFKEDKSPSQRLRNVIYRVWEKQGGGQGTHLASSNMFYQDKMEEIIKHFKKTLD